MGKDMSSVNAPFGFSVWGECLREHIYAVNTAPTIGVYIGDMVLHGGAALATKHGTMVIIEDGAVPDGVSNTAKELGVVTAIFDENMDPVTHIIPATVGDGTVAGYVLVADHPDQLFLVQENGATAAIDLADVGQNTDVVSVALCAGNTDTGISKQMIASDLVAATAALDVRVISPHPDDTVGDDTNCYCRWIVQLNTHYFVGFNTGA